MLKRIISAAIGIALFVTVLLVSDEFNYFFNGIISLMAVISVWEIFHATKYIENKALLIVSMIFAASVPFFRMPYFGLTSKAACFIYVVVLFAVMIFDRKRVKIEQIGLVFMLCTLIPFAFSTLIYVRDMGFRYLYGMSRRDGVFLLLLCCAGAWIADTGAYFTGRFLGKHKLAPTISPKKTVEGFIGGIALNIVGVMGAGLIYETWFAGGDITVNYVLLGIIGAVTAVMGTLGDLSASFIKRSCDVKDFGNIMPGHGGVLDRFDSVMLVAPTVYIFVEIFQPSLWPLIIRG